MQLKTQLQEQSLFCRIGKGTAFGTFGELLQGVGSDDQDFLVTLPIQRYSTVIFTSQPDREELIVSPSSKKKSAQLAKNILKYFNLPQGGMLEIVSTVPVGKGLASSSADLVATARAISHCFDIELEEEQLETMLHQIEPTDGVMYEGVVSFYHRRVKLQQFLGMLPPLTIVSIDEGGEVDTVEFNQFPKPFTEEEKQGFDQLLKNIAKAITAQDLKRIGEISTHSAVLNQKLKKKKFFEHVMEICNVIHALGVIVTHSGTCIGILLSPEDEHYTQQLQTAYDKLYELAGEVTIYHSIS
ncbi:GHMP family kinase ATP-binding protein [Longirhabdus pacifica]|uniref:GHMP family kinase ATP-binding protein n=1 Tax=Longirhabdus pacifica TaxID=2305227 RepID=UPI0010092D75|nr:kinase [Longirhabdus pacifica]